MCVFHGSMKSDCHCSVNTLQRPRSSVRNHTAMRRNIHQPERIRQFSGGAPLRSEGLVVVPIEPYWLLTGARFVVARMAAFANFEASETK
jgi:hypothetical protein